MVEFGIGFTRCLPFSPVKASTFVALDISRSALEEALEGLRRIIRRFEWGSAATAVS